MKQELGLGLKLSFYRYLIGYNWLTIYKINSLNLPRLSENERAVRSRKFLRKNLNSTALNPTLLEKHKELQHK